MAQAARDFGVAWATAMAAVIDHGRPRVDHLARLGAPTAIGLDETAWLRATATHGTRLVTGIVDLDAGRLVDVLPERSADAVSGWLGDKPASWRARIRWAVIDPYAGYARGLADGLADAGVVVDHFHAVRLANQALDDVRRRVQQTTTGHRGRKPDPLYRIRRRLLAGHERLRPSGFDRVLAWLAAGDPDGEVAAAYLAKELLREVYAARDPFTARRALEAFHAHCADADIHELTRLSRTIRRWGDPDPRVASHRAHQRHGRRHQPRRQERQTTRRRVHQLRQLPAPGYSSDVAPHGNMHPLHQYDPAAPG